MRLAMSLYVTAFVSCTDLWTEHIAGEAPVTRKAGVASPATLLNYALAFRQTTEENHGKTHPEEPRSAGHNWLRGHGRLFQAASIDLPTFRRPQLNPQRTVGHRNCLLWRPLSGLEACFFVDGAEAPSTPPHRTTWFQKIYLLFTGGA